MKKATYLLAIMVLASLFTNAQTLTADTKINISKLIAYEQDNRIFIDWSADAGTKSNYWEIQTSADGKKFSTIALVMGPDPSKPGEEYQYRDKVNAKNTTAYYRIVHTSTTGVKQPSNIIKLMKLDSTSFINPGIKNTASL